MLLERIGWTAAKGFRLQHLPRAQLTVRGLAHDRDVVVLDAAGAINLYDISALLRVEVDYDAAADELVLTFPDGRVVRGSAAPVGAQVVLDYLGSRAVRLLGGQVGGAAGCPLDEALTAWAGTPVRLARVERTGDGIDVLPVSLISTASVADLSERVGRVVSSARFRSTFEVSGPSPYEEDTWAGRRVRVGAAVLRVSTPIPRCGITGFDPETGRRTGAVLRDLRRYRPLVGLPPQFPEHTGVAMAVYAEVLQPGTVVVGDLVELLDD